MADALGHHSSLCMAGGARMLAHHTIRNWLHTLASSASQYPRKEVCPFTSRPNLRVDLYLATTRIAVDNALISVFSREHTALATTAPAAAADAYEQSKVDTYGASAATDNIRLVPFVVDCFGATSKSCRPFLSVLIASRATRFNASIPATRSALQRDFSVMLQGRVASLLLPNANTLADLTTSPYLDQVAASPLSLPLVAAD